MNEYFEKMINEYGFEKREGQEKMAENYTRSNRK